MKALFTENEMLSLGMIYDYYPGIIIVGNIYDKTRTVFVREGQMWRKIGEICYSVGLSTEQSEQSN